MVGSSPNTLGEHLANLKVLEIGFRDATIDAMDAMGRTVTERLDEIDEYGAPSTIEEFIFAIHCLRPDRERGQSVKAYYDAAAKQFGESSWGELFSIDADSKRNAQVPDLHAIDGDEVRAWQARNPISAYNPLGFRIESANGGQTLIGKVVLPNVLTVKMTNPNILVKQQALFVTSFVRTVGVAASSSEVAVPEDLLPKIIWLKDIVSGKVPPRQSNPLNSQVE